MARIAINGLGRIGRALFKLTMADPRLEVVAINDLTPLDSLVYLLRYDTVYGRYDKEVTATNGNLTVDGKSIRTFNAPTPDKLPWHDLGVELVFECTGFFRRDVDLHMHLSAGARHVILSAPPKGETLPQVVYGVSNPNDDLGSAFSTASCTTNCIAPVLEIMERRIGVIKSMMTTVHAYTANQGIVDSSADRRERGRAGAANLVPTSTGAATATSQVLPHFKGKFDGIAIRVPVAAGSIADITMVMSRRTTVDEVNSIFREEADSVRYQGILGVTHDPIVSSDIIGDSRASIIDTRATRVVDGDLVKVMSWYDNEYGYASQMYRQGLQVLRV